MKRMKRPFAAYALILAAILGVPVRSGAQTERPRRFPLLDNAAAWRCLGRLDVAAQPLPAWARTTAPLLPRTTTALLELDRLHRAESPLPARLRGMMRWTAAHANRCAVTEAQALDDLRRAGVAPAVLDMLTQAPHQLPADDQAALTFARKLTAAAYTVTDAEVAQLIKTHGEKQVVAMVQLLAHANFQDRLVHALGVASAEPLPPLAVRFGQAKPAKALHVPPRQAPTAVTGPEPAKQITDPEWRAFNFDALQAKLAGQRGREPRIRVPTWDEYVQANPEAPAKPLRIRWSLVCSGYQPQLGKGWGACTGAFRAEAQQDRAFEELLFWVVTRSLNCFY